MKKEILIVLALILIVSVNAQDLNDYDNLKISTKISSTLDLETSNNAGVKYVYANLTFFPENKTNARTPA